VAAQEQNVDANYDACHRHDVQGSD
jgi:hypothetical protein